MTNTDAIKKLEEAMAGFNRYIECYDNGANDVWELIRKCVYYPIEGGLSANEMEDIFGTVFISDIVRKYTPQEALEKYKAWKEKKAWEERKKKEKAEKIHIGDVVEIWVRTETVHGTRTDIYTGVVLKNTDVNLYYMNSHGDLSTVQYIENVRVKKTGKRVDILGAFE